MATNEMKNDCRSTIDGPSHENRKRRCVKSEGTLDSGCQHRPVPYLNNVLEQDHRTIKRRVNASQHFRSFWAAWRTIAGYEAIHMIRKGQANWGAACAKLGLLQNFILDLFSAVAV